MSSPADLPVAAPDHAQIVRRVLGPRKRASDAVREAHFALDALLAERQQDKERIERLETALSVYADPRHWAISRDDLAMRVVSWIDRLLCRVFGHCYDAYRIPIRCMYCGQRWRARGVA